MWIFQIHRNRNVQFADEWLQWCQRAARQNNAAHIFAQQILHTEAGTEAPVVNHLGGGLRRIGGLRVDPAIVGLLATRRFCLLIFDINLVTFGHASAKIIGRAGEDDDHELVQSLQTNTTTKCGIFRFGITGQELIQRVQQADHNVMIGLIDL